MKKYRFRLSETSWIELSQDELIGYQDVNLEDNKKGKIIPITREFDKKRFGLVVPIELLEDNEKFMINGVDNEQKSQET